MTARAWQVLIASVLGCAILIGLGAWQLQRLETKQALLRQIEERRTQTPVSLEQALLAAEASGDIDYLPIRTRGRFDPQTEFFMLTTFDGAAAEKAHGAAIDDFFRIEPRRPVHLAAEAKLGVFVRTHNPGLGLAQARKHFLRIVADGRDDAHSGDDDTSHSDMIPYDPYGRPRQFRKAALKAQAPLGCKASSCLNKPTLRSLAR